MKLVLEFTQINHSGHLFLGSIWIADSHDYSHFAVQKLLNNMDSDATVSSGHNGKAIRVFREVFK